MDFRLPALVCHTPPKLETTYCLLYGKASNPHRLDEVHFSDHNPTWSDCQQLLLTLFNTEEHRRVTQAALQRQENTMPDGTNDVWH